MDSKSERGEIKSIHISRERKDLISQYATAAVCLYGVISLGEFVNVFNGYEIAHTTTEEALMALNKLAKTDDAEYSISGDILSGPEFQPSFDDYAQNVESISACQSGKPRYLPDKAEFLRYVEFGYREPEKPYTDLKAYILKNELTTCGEGIGGVDGDLLDLHEMIQLGVEPSEELQYFSERGYYYKNAEILNVFSDLVMDVHNNTRMYENNGFTAMEMYEELKHLNNKRR